MLKVASFLSWFSGLGFGIPCLYGIWTMLNGRGIAYVLGFPTYGQGPFEKIGVNTTVSLLFGFLLVCVLECVAGSMLWSNDKGGAVVALTLIPIAMAFFIGFGLPFGPVFLFIRTLLLLLSWSSFNQLP